MNKRLFLMGIVIIGFLMTISIASAYTPNIAPYANGVAYGYAGYGSWPVNPSITGRQYPYAETPVRVGGFFGANSAFVIGLKPGIYDGPIMTGWSRQVLTSQYYTQARTGGFFGNRPMGYFNLRPGSFVFSGGMPTYPNTPYMYRGGL